MPRDRGPISETPETARAELAAVLQGLDRSSVPDPRLVVRALALALEAGLLAGVRADRVGTRAVLELPGAVSYPLPPRPGPRGPPRGPSGRGGCARSASPPTCGAGPRPGPQRGDPRRRAPLLRYSPVDLQTLRKRPDPAPELLPGLARARGWAHTGAYGCAGPVFGFEPTGLRPPLVERGHERAVARDLPTSTRAERVGPAVRWHETRLEEIAALVGGAGEAPDDGDGRPGYAFWGGAPAHPAGPPTDRLYEQHQPQLP